MTEKLTLNISFWKKNLKKHVQIQKQNYSTKRKKQVISESFKILFQPESNFLSSLQSCLIYIKLCQFGFSGQGFLIMGA